MNCPIDNTPLSMTERSGVEIDYCPQCRGVWLDRGELDKIIDRANAEVQPADNRNSYAAQNEQPQYQSRKPEYRESHYGHDDDKYDNRHGHHKKKRESFLGDLFDF